MSTSVRQEIGSTGENSVVKSSKHKGTNGAAVGLNSGRKTLQERSTNTTKQPSLIGKDGFLSIGKKAKSFSVYKDEAPKSPRKKDNVGQSHAYKNVSVQTTLSGNDYAMSGDISFYKDLSEKRRVALDEGLKENEAFYLENQSLKEMNESLKAENETLKDLNESLSETVDKARKISEMLGPLLNDDEEGEPSNASDDADEEVADGRTEESSDELEPLPESSSSNEKNDASDEETDNAPEGDDAAKQEADHDDQKEDEAAS